MKRIIAFALTLMLCFSLLSVTALAAEPAYLGISSAQAEAGSTVTLYISIDAPAIGGADISYTYDNSILELVEFAATAGGWTVGTHAIWECGSTTNGSLSGTILSLTFKVKDSAKIGDSAQVSVFGSGYSWNEDGMSYEPLAIGGATGTVTVACNHVWDNGVVTKEHTCFEDGIMTYTCTKCGETKTEAIPAAHAWETTWSYNTENHWHKCSVCGEIKDKDIHHMNIVDAQAPEGDVNGYYLWDCDQCDYQWRETWYPDEEPKVGDIRPMMAMGAFAVLFTLAAAAYVFKRKVNF